MSDMNTAGLRLEQAPPLSVVAGFFVVAPLFLVAGGVLLLVHGSALLATRLSSATAALAHFATLGFLASTMLGALYQMIPVVAGRPVPFVRVAYAVLGLHVLGVSSLAVGLLGDSRPALHSAATCLGLGFIGFLGPVLTAVFRAPTRTATTRGMAVALAGLCVVVVLGTTLAATRGSSALGAEYPRLLVLHAGFGLVVWLGGLVCAVSFQVVPMFYLAPESRSAVPFGIVVAIALTLLGLMSVLVLRPDSDLFWLAALAPGGVAVWGVHPVVTLRALAARRRKRSDPSLRSWQLGLACGTVLLPLAIAASWLEDSRWAIALGWLLLVGWGTSIVQGMLSRIVPFLVWFHRFSSWIGKAPVPPMRRLWPAGPGRAAPYAQLFTVLAGLLAIALRSDWAARAAGVGLASVGTLLLYCVARVLREPAPVAPAPAAGGNPVTMT
ncbi:MAG: hypothetical protein R3B13_01230 [Polyangiaceae bacterium]